MLEVSPIYIKLLTVFTLPDHSYVTPEPVVLILGACQQPGAAIARALAKSGARVILIDGDSKALTKIAASDPDNIETLTLPKLQSDMTHLLRDAWGAEPLDMVVNLMPLAFPDAIAEQMRTLSAIFRATARGLVAARGSIVSLVSQPKAPLALVGQGRLAALQAGSGALGQAVAKHGVRTHVISVPDNRRSVAVECLQHLITPAAKPMASTTIELA